MDILNEIKINVETFYLPNKSSIEKSLYFFMYKVTISNQSDKTVQLINRHWNISYANENVRIVEGEGVIGEKPIMKPNTSFEYNSFCPLPTEFGVMHGHFEMIYENGKKINAKIAPFRLTIPFSIN